MKNKIKQNKIYKYTIYILLFLVFPSLMFSAILKTLTPLIVILTIIIMLTIMFFINKRSIYSAKDYGSDIILIKINKNGEIVDTGYQLLKDGEEKILKFKEFDLDTMYSKGSALDYFCVETVFMDGTKESLVTLKLYVYLERKELKTQDLFDFYRINSLPLRKSLREVFKDAIVSIIDKNNGKISDLLDSYYQIECRNVTSKEMSKIEYSIEEIFDKNFQLKNGFFIKKTSWSLRITNHDSPSYYWRKEYLNQWEF